jgi:hypothetical protein
MVLDSHNMTVTTAMNHNRLAASFERDMGSTASAFVGQSTGAADAVDMQEGLGSKAAAAGSMVVGVVVCPRRSTKIPEICIGP